MHMRLVDAVEFYSALQGQLIYLSRALP